MATGWKDLKLNGDGRVISGVFTLDKDPYRFTLDVSPITTSETLFGPGNVVLDGEAFPTSDISDVRKTFPPQSFCEQYAHEACSSYLRKLRKAAANK